MNHLIAEIGSYPFDKLRRLLSTISPDKKTSLLEISERYDVEISEIGKITREPDLRVIERGSLKSFSKSGYNHFNE